MADTVEQLRKKFDEATRKAKAAKRAILFSEKYDKPSLQQQYTYAKANKTSDLAQIEAKYRKAQEEYNRLQTEADKLEKQIGEAEKTAATQKSRSDAQKQATDKYNQALSKLKEAEGSITFYQGQEKYVKAYQEAQNAFDAAAKVGASVPNLPAQKITVPKTEQKTPETKTQTPEEQAASYTKFIDVLADPKNKKLLTDVQKDLIKNFGWNGKADGQWSSSFQNALQRVETTRLGLPTALRTDIRSFILKPTISTADIVSGGKGGGTTTDVTKSVEKMTQADIDAMINKSAQQILGREIVAEDKTADWYQTLNAGIKKMLESGTTYKTVSTTRDGSTTSSRVITPGYSTEKAGQLIEKTLKTADPQSLARKERVDFVSWMFQNLGGK